MEHTLQYEQWECDDNSSYLSEAYWVVTYMRHFINNRVRDRLLLNSFSRQESWDSKSLSPVSQTQDPSVSSCSPFLKNGSCSWPTSTLGVKAEEPIRTAETIKWVGTILTIKQFWTILKLHPYCSTARALVISRQNYFTALQVCRWRLYSSR